MVRIQDNNGQFSLTIPRDIARLKGWGQGSEVALILDSNGNVAVIDITEKKKGGKK